MFTLTKLSLIDNESNYLLMNSEIKFELFKMFDLNCSPINWYDEIELLKRVWLHSNGHKGKQRLLMKLF